MDTLELLDEVVAIGSTVVVRDLENNEVAIYTLAPPNQADISRNRISSLTPVAHALYGRSAGETVEVAAPGGPIQLRIESVLRDADDGEYG